MDLSRTDVQCVDEKSPVHGNDTIRQENDLKLKKMLRERNIEYISIGGIILRD